MSFETSVGTSDADSITVMGRDLARDLMGKATLSELAFLVVQRPHAHAGGGAPLRRRAGLARRPRPHPHRPRRAAHPYRRAGIAPGGDRGRPAGCGERLPGCRGGHGAVPRRGGRRRGGRRGARARGGPADPGARPPDPQGRGPAHAADLRDRRGDGPHRLVSRAADASWPPRTRARPAGSCRSTARAWPGRRWPTSASRARCCADSRCWRGPRGCSVTSRKRCRALSGCVSTARWMSVRSMPRQPGSSGGVQATSGGWQ